MKQAEDRDVAAMRRRSAEVAQQSGEGRYIERFDTLLPWYTELFIRLSKKKIVCN